MNVKLPSCKAILLFLALSSLLIGHAAAPKYDQEKLRSLVKLPSMNVEFGFMASTEFGFTLAGEPLDLGKMKPPSEKIADLQKEIHGGVQDAERFLELSGLYATLKNEAQSQAALQRSIELFRERVQDNPRQGWARSQLGAALAQAGQQVEGEGLLQAAVALAPEDWRCWKHLGVFLTSLAYDAFGITNRAALMAELQRVAQSQASSPALWSERRAKASGFWDEAKRAFDKGVSAAPLEGEAYLARVAFRMAHEMFLEPLLVSHPPENPQAAKRALFDLVVPDLKQAAKLMPQDPYAMGMAVFLDAVSSIPEGALDDFDRVGVWPGLPDSARTYAREGMSRLEKLSQSQDRTVAGGALAALGGLQFFLQRDNSNAEKNLRRAIELRPAAQQPWEILSSLFVDAERWADLVASCEQHLKLKDSVRTRLTLAKAYERLNKTAEVEKQVQAALKLEPDNLLANIASAASQLKRATDDEALNRVGEFMRKIEATSLQSAPPELKMAFEFVHGILFALAGNRDEAARHYRFLLMNDPGNKDYQAASEALGR